LFPASSQQITAMGERFRLARLRRKYAAETVAKRAGIARATLYRLEKGDPGVSIATCASVLSVLGLKQDLDLVAKDDVLGRKLQDLDLPMRQKAPRKSIPKNPATKTPQPEPNA